MSLKYLNLTGLSRVITNLKNWVVSQIPTKTSEITNDSGFITSTSDCVHIAGAETVTGQKSYTNYQDITGYKLRIKAAGQELGTTPSSNAWNGFAFTDKNLNSTFTIENGFLKNGTTQLNFSVYPNVANSTKLSFFRYYYGNSNHQLYSVNLAPDGDDTYYLGASNNKWKAVYSNAYYLGSTAFGDIVTHNSSEYSLSSHTHSNYLSNSLTNNTSKGALGWSSSIGTNIPTLNTLAYWNGAYTNTSSNLAYCVKGAFGDIVTHNASEFLTSHQSLSNYSTKANTVKSLSISGKTITVTPGSGSTYTLTTQDTVYTHPTSAGNKHIPSGGAANQYLKYSASGTAVWADLPTIPTKTSQLTNDSGFLTSHQSLAGYLPLTGGVLTGGISRKHTGVTKGTNPDSICYWSVYNCDKDGTNYKNDCLGLFETSLNTAGVVSTYIRAMKNTANNTSNASLGVAYDTANNLGYTFAPTPAANDNTTKIATTAWVQTFCGTTKGYLTSHQSLSNYSTKANTVKSLSISGKTITVTPGSGDAYTLTTQDTVYTHPTSAGNKHIPSGGSSGQILKYSSSGTAVWADVDFSRKPDTTVFSKTAWPADGTSTISCTTGCPIWIFFDVTGDNSCKISLSLSNVFVIATKMCVGSQTHKQDTTTYGTILVQSAVGRNRGTVLAWAWSTSLTLTVSHTGTFTNTPSFSVSMKQ